MNSLQQLDAVGQRVWLDFLRRGMIPDTLERMILEDALSGVTSNPSIFGKAIGGSTDYDDAVRALAEEGGHRPIGVFYDLALADVAMAADVFRRRWDGSGGADGFVSFELEPRLARDTAGSIGAALEIFAKLGRPNVMIKVPGTDEGVPAVEELTAAGVNVNITLLFSVEAYEKVALAYIAGLERRLEAGQSLNQISSVASFFVSRVDTAVDALLPQGSPLRGKAAIANAKLAYRRFCEIFDGKRWDRLSHAGARVQRPLWASTGTKNHAYRDVMYIEELVGPNTVNTIPQQTMDAFRDHGAVRALAVEDDVEEAARIPAQLAEHGIDLGAVCAKLLDDGIRAFDDDLEKLLAVIEQKLARARSSTARGAGDA